MKGLHQAVDDYLALRRSLGFKLEHYEDCLHSFVSFLQAHRSPHITSKLAVEYATRRQEERPASWAHRLDMIRGFATYRRGADPQTEIPPIGLLPMPSQRARPYLCSAAEVRCLLAAARDLKSRHPLRPWTHYCVFGLLAVSGMRLGEVVSLQTKDVNLAAGILTLRGAKFGKSRLVPLHRSTRAVLRDYARRRDRLFAPRPASPFFVNSRGGKLWKADLSQVFRRLSHQVGLRAAGRRPGPRLHDFRHRFAIQTLLRGYRDGREVARRLPALSTYLGHVNVTGTYWYLGSTPELMAAASQLLEARWKGVA